MRTSVVIVACAAPAVAQDLFLGYRQPESEVSNGNYPSPKKASLPSVTAHGMGDSCFNSGFKGITDLIAEQTGQYSVCIPTGDNQASDTTNGFFMTMDKSVDIFAEKIRADSNLANGFNCIGLSQGNSLCRGYIQKYNDPPVDTWISVHGTVVGVAGFPNCNPQGLLGPICGMLDSVLGTLAYTDWAQNLLFQADYYRDPMRVDTDAFKTKSQIAQWNNEGNTVDSSINANFAKTNKFVMIKANKDSMIYPNEGEHWGQFAPGSRKQVLTMKETDWYKNDLFGLRTADEAGKISFNETDGDHLEFTHEQMAWWVNNYLN